MATRHTIHVGNICSQSFGNSVYKGRDEAGVILARHDLRRLISSSSPGTHYARKGESASASGHCSRPLLSLSRRRILGTVYSSTPTTEELLKRAKDLIRKDQEYLKDFNAAIDQLQKKKEEFQAEHPPFGTRYS